MRILAIESSCDESAASVIEGRSDQLKVLSNVVSSQIDIHRQYGGVVPEVAARHHVLNILPVVKEALKKASPPLGKRRDRVGSDLIDAIAVTAGPGLVTSLIVGVETAKALAFAWQKPLVPVNHIEGHIYSAFISQKNAKNKIKFPLIALTVSGGHTMLVLMKDHLQYKTVGQTRDDAAGEAFDKGAKLLNLGYPGGPAIAASAATSVIASPEHGAWQSRDHNISTLSYKKIIFPRPMIHDDNFDFSFSGLKTSLLYQLPKDKNWQEKIPAYADEYQRAIVDVLVAKTIKAAKHFKVKTVLLTGGVSANQALRQSLAAAVADQLSNTVFHTPELAYTTENAAMIASAGYFKFKAGRTISPARFKIDPNWTL